MDPVKPPQVYLYKENVNIGPRHVIFDMLVVSVPKAVMSHTLPRRRMASSWRPVVALHSLSEERAVQGLPFPQVLKKTAGSRSIPESILCTCLHSRPHSKILRLIAAFVRTLTNSESFFFAWK